MEQSKFYQIKNITEQEYTLVGCDGSVITRPIQEIDKIASSFTIQDAKDGDVLITNKKQPFIFNGHYDEDTDYIYAYCGISDLVKDDSFYCEKEGIEEEFNVWCTNENVCPTTKEQRDILFSKMREAGYEWDAENKELKKIHIIDEGKAEMDYCFTKMMKGEKVAPAWNEEDEKMLGKCIDATSGYYSPEEKQSMKDWLKSLKDRIGG